jgi:hypothetical protein
VRTTLAGEPMMRELSGNSLPSVTTLPAPTIELRPIFALFKTTAWMPISELSPMVQPCSITWWPTVTLSPMVSGQPTSACSTDRSWMLLLRPMRHRLGVPAQHGAEPDAGVLAQLDVAHHLRAVGHPAPSPSCGATPSSS